MDNCINIISRIFEYIEESVKLEDQVDVQIMYSLFNKSIDIAAFNINYILSKHLPKFKKELRSNVVEMILDKALYIYSKDPHFDNSKIIEVLMDLHHFNSVFKLLKHAKEKITVEQTELLSNPDLGNTLSWSLAKINGNIFRETDPFTCENSHWSLTMTYF